MYCTVKEPQASAILPNLDHILLIASTHFTYYQREFICDYSLMGGSLNEAAKCINVLNSAFKKRLF